MTEKEKVFKYIESLNKSGTLTSMVSYFMTNTGISIGVNIQKLAIRVFYF